MSIFGKLTERVGDFFDEVMLPEAVRRIHEDASRAMEAGSYDSALALLQPTLIEHPNIARTHHLIGMCHYRRAQWGYAIAAFERALAIKEHAQSHYHAGLAAEQVGRWADVLRHFNRALAMGEELPFAFELHYGLGRAYRALGRPDKAVKELRAALKLTPDQFDASATLVEALLDRDQVGQAEAVLEAMEPSRKPRYLVLRGELAERRASWDNALAAFADAAASAGPEQVRASLGAARNALRTGDVEAAARFLDELEPITDAHRVECAILRGRVAEQQGRVDDAHAQFNLALQENADHPEAHLGMGRVGLLRGDPDAAAAHFVRVFRDQDPARRQEAWWGLGRCHAGSGDLAGARRLFEQALDLEGPLRATLLQALGKTALELGDPAEALVFLRDALEELPPEKAGSARQALDEALVQLSPSWDLPEQLDEPVKLQQLLEQLSAYLGRDARLSEFLPAAQRLHATLNSPLSLAIVGEFNAGKSTLVNALIKEDVFPVGVLPTTAHTGILRWGPRKAARVVFLDGTREEQSLADARQTMKTNADAIERLEFTHPHPDLRLVHYWDTPGFNALEERHERVAAEALGKAEAILWVMDANQVLSQTEFDRIESLPDGAERLLVVINKIDRLGGPGERDDEVEHLLEYVNENLDGRIAGCFAISARDASSEDPEVREASGFEEFRTFLETHVVQRAGRIKTLEVRRSLEGLVLTLDSFQQGLVQRYAQLGTNLDAVVAWLDAEAAAVPVRRSREEIDTLNLWSEHALEGIETEIADALRPTGSWLGRLVLHEEDRDFILALLLERFDRLLDVSWQRTSGALTEVENSLAERVDPVVRSLALGDARALQRRLDGFFDEVRVLEMLWEERVYGALRARARGRVETAGGSALDTIEGAATDRTVWRRSLKELLPAIDEEFATALHDWYASFFDAARRFAARVRGDLELLELEAKQRYDVADVYKLVISGPLQPSAADSAGETTDHATN